MEGEIIDTLEKEEEQQEVVELPGVTALKILGKTNHSSIYANNGKVADENDSNIKTRKNMDNNVNNKNLRFEPFNILNMAIIWGNKTVICSLSNSQIKPILNKANDMIFM